MGLTGRWRIVEMDTWDREDLDLVEPAFIEFTADATGQFGFVAVRGWMDCRSTKRDGHACIEFSWDGDDDCSHVSGRGWAMVADNDTLLGHLFVHLGDDYGFQAVRFGGRDALEAR